MSARKRVEAGARLLDEELGTDWVLDIDLERFSIGSCSRCVLGQLYGNFWGALVELGDGLDSALNGCAYGFDWGGGETNNVTASELNTLWVDVIWERLKRFAA